MTNDKKIPSSAKGMMDVFFHHNFEPMTIKELANYIDEEPNTVNQRLLRDKGTYFERVGKRPKKIIIKQGLDEVLFYLYKNQCQICKRMFKPANLDVSYREENIPNKNRYSNIFPICVACKSKPQPPLMKKGRKKKSKTKTNQLKNIWEYLNVRIRSKQGLEDGEPGSLITKLIIGSKIPFVYYEWIEIKDSNQIEDEDWFHLIEGSDEEISSRNVTDVLNYFGKEGWELTSIREKNNKSDFWSTEPSFYPNIYPFKNKEFECFFKRKISPK